MSLFHGPSIVTPGLLLLLDPANPRSYPGSGTTYYDLSGNGINATLNGTATITTQGVYLVNSVSNNTQYVTVPVAPFEFGTSNFTISGWAQAFVGNLGTPSIFGSNNGGTLYPSSRYGIAIDQIDNNPGTVSYTAMSIDSGGITTPSAATPYNAYVAGMWVYVAGVYNRSASLLSCFVNGVLVGTGTFPNATNSLGSNSRVGMGSWVAGSNIGLNGYLGPTLIYNRALSSNEVAQNFNAHRGRYGL